MKFYDPGGYRLLQGIPVVLDTETTVRNKGPEAIGPMQASPFHPDNKIVLTGFLNMMSVEKSDDYDTVLRNRVYIMDGTWDKSLQSYCLIGHNIKFDLLHMMHAVPDPYVLLTENWVWDTMIVEYLLTGQQEKMPSLDKLTKKYGGVLKDEKIKKYWEEGKDTIEIPRNELDDYLSHDVTNTAGIFVHQYAKARTMPGMMELIRDQMRTLLTLTMMEFNGMHIDMDVFLLQMKEVMEDLKSIERSLMTAIGWAGFNIDSVPQLAAWLYGGNIISEEKTPVLDINGDPVLYKSGVKKGTVRMQKVKVPHRFPGIFPDTYDRKTDEETLRTLHTKAITSFQEEVIDLLLKYRELTKEFNTYYVGVGEHIWPHDSCIHGSLQMGVTSTGRLSSARPNMQNLPTKTED